MPGAGGRGPEGWSSFACSWLSTRSCRAIVGGHEHSLGGGRVRGRRLVRREVERTAGVGSSQCTAADLCLCDGDTWAEQAYNWGMSEQSLHRPPAVSRRRYRRRQQLPSAVAPVVAVDVGSSSVRFAAPGRNVVVEPNVVAVAGEEVVAVGWAALEASREDPKQVANVYPVCGGTPVHHGLYTARPSRRRAGVAAGLVRNGRDLDASLDRASRVA